MKQMSADDACVCGSRKRWASCCGRHLREKETTVGFVSLTGKQSVRFFLGNMFTNEAFTDDEDNVIVFTSRAQALSCNESLNGAYHVIGMSEEKWSIFREDVPNHVVISDAIA